MDFDSKYYLIRFSAALNAQEETVYSIGQIRQRSFPADAGSSSTKEALKNGRKVSNGIIFSSDSKSQEVKTALQIAYERALNKKDNKTVEEMDVEVGDNTESVAPAILKSERTWTESDYVQERDAAAKEIAKAIGVSEKKAKDYIDSVNSIAKMIADDRTRLDYFSSPNRSSFVSKVEYGGTKFTKSSFEAMAGNLMKANNAKGNKQELAKLLNGLYEYIAKEQKKEEPDQDKIDAYTVTMANSLRGKKKNTVICGKITVLAPPARLELTTLRLGERTFPY